MVTSLLFVLLWQPQTAALASLYESELARVEATNGDVGKAAFDLGLFLFRQNNPQAAVAPLARAAKILNTDIAREAHAQALLASKNAPEAEAAFTQLAESKDPKLAARALTALADLTGNCALHARAISLEESIPRLNDLGLCEREHGRNAQAIKQFRRALSLDPQGKNPETAVTLNNLASALLDTGADAEAELHQRRAWRILDTILGSRHTRTALSASNLADILLARGKASEARRFYSLAYEVFNNRLGPAHPWTLEAKAALTSAPRP
jgi:tetratricopeptide (TPR) repeat protein